MNEKEGAQPTYISRAIHVKGGWFIWRYAGPVKGLMWIFCVFILSEKWKDIVKKKPLHKTLVDS